jgi:hypothetical protein
MFGLASSAVKPGRRHVQLLEKIFRVEVPGRAGTWRTWQTIPKGIDGRESNAATDSF